MELARLWNRPLHEIHKLHLLCHMKDHSPADRGEVPGDTHSREGPLVDRLVVAHAARSDAYSHIEQLRYELAIAEQAMSDAELELRLADEAVKNRLVGQRRRKPLLT